MSVAHNGEARLKWPDDLLNDGVKCTGILLERAGDSIVIGMGVNLVSAPELPDRPTVCFADKGVTIDRDRFAEVLAVALTDALWTWRHEGIDRIRSEEHTSELQSLMRISYAVFCLKKKH